MEQWQAKKVVKKATPTFYEVWSVMVSDDEVDDETKSKVHAFMALGFTARIAKEVWQGLQQDIAEGKVSESEFSAHMANIMASDDEEAKSKLVAEITNKYSLTAHLVKLANGEGSVPDDLSSLAE